MAKKILIAEDEKPLARAMELKLAHEGFDVQVVNDGEAALQIVTSNGPFDLILLDLMMPKLGGFEVLEKMKAKNIVTPVIVMSNLSQEVDRQKVLDLGAKEILVKSNTPLAEVVSHINEILK